MNPLTTIESILDSIFGFVFGRPFDLQMIIAIGMIFGVGYLIGKLTKNLSFFGVIGIIILGSFAYDLLKFARPAYVWVFIIGILVHHGGLWYRSMTWARGIGDFVFATRYRKAFEDIRRREAELDELEKRLRAQARANARTTSESDTQKRWREQAQTRSGGTSSSSAGSSGGSGYSARNDSAREDYLRTMGLKPQSQYSTDELKKAYRKRARETHPDLGGSTSDFQQVANAYEWLLRNQGG